MLAYPKSPPLSGVFCFPLVPQRKGGGRRFILPTHPELCGNPRRTKYRSEGLAPSPFPCDEQQHTKAQQRKTPIMADEEETPAPKRKVFVQGVSGYIGGNVAKRFARKASR